MRSEEVRTQKPQVLALMPCSRRLNYEPPRKTFTT